MNIAGVYLPGRKKPYFHTNLEQLRTQTYSMSVRVFYVATAAEHDFLTRIVLSLPPANWPTDVVHRIASYSSAYAGSTV